MELVDLGTVAVVGIVVEAPGEELATAVPKAWEALRAVADELPGGRPDVLVEASFGLDGGRYREVLGVEVAPGTPAPPGFELVELPAARWAHARHDGPLAGIAAAFGELQGALAAHGLAHDEVLLDRGYRLDGDGPHDLFVRVAGSART